MGKNKTYVFADKIKSVVSESNVVILRNWSVIQFPFFFSIILQNNKKYTYAIAYNVIN